MKGKINKYAIVNLIKLINIKITNINKTNQIYKINHIYRINQYIKMIKIRRSKTRKINKNNKYINKIK